MAVHSFRDRRAALRLLVVWFVYFQHVLALTGSVYQLDSEYKGANFFQGWDFFTGGDPTGGFVTYYSQGSAQLAGMINSSDTSPVYIGSDYTSSIGSTQAAGRPSVRISTQRSWTHGLFIGDFNHAPGGVCGTWPAFWTLAPNWPYNGEIDIMEGVNLVNYNAATLHASVNCTIAGDSRFMTGQLSNNNCAYYPGYNVGCGVRDNRTTSFGSGFNAIGGGVYAMQWTTDYIRVWFFPRGTIPSDITNGTPNPSSWGLPSANLQGSCIIDQKFQNHKIILNNAFCGEYAGAASVWNSTIGSCATSTGYSTCNAYVAGVPGAFQNAYWSINSIRVYQLADPSNATSSGAPYIASNQPTQSTVAATSASTPVPTTSLCPTYNFTVVQSGNFKYEIECGVNVGGSDLGKPYPSYSYTNFEGCVGGCTYWNTYNATNICGGVTYLVASNACYWKRSVTSTPAQAGYNGARLIYYAYPQVTDDPRSRTTTSATSAYVATSVTPNYYAPSNVTTTAPMSLITETPTANITNGGGLGGGFTSTDDTTDSGTDSPMSTSMANTTTSRRSFTGSRTRTSSTTVTIAPVSSLSSLASTQATAVPSTTPVSLPSSSPMLSPSSTSAQLSSRGLSLSTSSSALVVPTTSGGLSNAPSTSFPTIRASTVVPSSMAGVSSTAGLATSSAVSQPSSSTLASTRTTQGVMINTSAAPSISTAPSSGSSAITPTTHASSSILPVSSSVFSSQAPAPFSSTINAGPATSSPATVVTSAASSPFPSTQFSQPPSGSQSPFSTSNPPPAISTTPIAVISSSSPSAITPPGSTTPVDSTTELSPSSTTSEILPGPTEITSDNGASFSLAGCLGPRPNTPFANSFILTEDSPSMSIERCVSDCSRDVYAGLYDTQCYCSSYSLPTDASEDFIQYPASACNTTCPGDPTQKCGGKISPSSPPSRFAKRQITDANGDVILLTVYNSTEAAGDVGSPSTTGAMSTSITSGSVSVGPGLGSTTSSAGGSGAGPFSTPPPPLVTSSISTLSTTAGSQTEDANLNTPSTTSTIASLPGFLISGIDNPTASMPISSLPLSPTIISTSYTTICALDSVTCPTRTETCLTTTVTMLHCGCTDMPEPNVPMTTTVVEACPTAPSSNSEGAESDMSAQAGAPAAAPGNLDIDTPLQMTPMITLTIPCASEISSLEAAVSTWSASASSATASPHPNIPYSFPITFPMTPSPSAATTQTLNLVVATAPFNFSVPSVSPTGNATWSGEVRNMTVVPVALSAMSAIDTGGIGATAGAATGQGSTKSGAMSVRSWTWGGDMMIYAGFVFSACFWV